MFLYCHASKLVQADITLPSMTASLKTLWQLFFCQYTIMLVHMCLLEDIPSHAPVPLLLCIIKSLKALCMVVFSSLSHLISLELNSNRFFNLSALDFHVMNAHEPTSVLFHATYQHPFIFNGISFIRFICWFTSSLISSHFYPMPYQVSPSDSINNMTCPNTHYFND